MTRLKHYDDLGTARFVTFSCYYHLPGLSHPGAKEIVIEELDRARAKHGFRLLGYVLMPYDASGIGIPEVERHRHFRIRMLKKTKIGII